MIADPAGRDDAPLALICGGGSLPRAVADFARARGRRVVLFPLHGAAEPGMASDYPHHWLYLGQAGRFKRQARAAGCRDVVFIGALVRPSLWQVRPDLLAFSLLPRVFAAYRGGDDHLLSSIGRLFEEHGFRLLGAHEVAPEILVPEGPLTRVRPSERDRADIMLALDYLNAAGPYDVGQAVVVANRHVLAVEAAEGTDAMLQRIVDLRASGRIAAPAGTGVLVKAPKRGQDKRFDLPSIGPKTVANAARAGLAGIAVMAGATIMAEPNQIVRAADNAGLFVVGMPAGGEI